VQSRWTRYVICIQVWSPINGHVPFPSTVKYELKHIFVVFNETKLLPNKQFDKRCLHDVGKSRVLTF